MRVKFAALPSSGSVTCVVTGGGGGNTGTRRRSAEGRAMRASDSAAGGVESDSVTGVDAPAPGGAEAPGGAPAVLGVAVSPHPATTASDSAAAATRSRFMPG
ncbi:hypothetical protein Asi03nite_32320 [Actinoplanes siamensis]|uniref:Uncharacterized protein n=1 Tax=Actinoplanes siamensis TaxID=1223317 RepID=A0A919TKW4_9ACTN|nr:hypothetical protein Asi03nite_32320 [Actinoplanes siamensis]